ncbi:MAG: PAS domain-containing protein [Coriobacteriales bacterium]|nr:PAS domain-containing protein [Coriobacteriales bacterium]
MEGNPSVSSAIADWLGRDYGIDEITLPAEDAVACSVRLPSGAPTDLLEAAEHAVRRLAHVDAEELDHELIRTLAGVGRRSNADRCYLYRVDGAASHTLRPTHEWAAPGVERRADLLDALDVTQVPRFLRTLRAGEQVFVPSVAELDDEYREERVLLDTHHVCTTLLAPVIFGGMLQGFVGLDWTRSADTADECRRVLPLVADAIADAVERALLERKIRGLGGALEHVPIGVTVSDPSGRILWANEAFSELAGRNPEAFVGTMTSERPFGLPPIEDLGVVLAALESGATWSHDVDLPEARGGPLVDHVSTFGVRGPDGSLDYVVTLHEDITSSQALQRQVRRARAAVAEANEELRLQARVVHEELSVGARRLVEAAELLGETDLTPEQRAIVGSIAGAGRRLLVVAGEEMP